MTEKKVVPAKDIQASPPDAPLRDKRRLPEGVVPKQAQGYVIAGLAVLILMAVMFSKNHARPASAASAESTPLSLSTDTNRRKIEELEQDLTADQRRSRQQQAQTIGAVATNGDAKTAATSNPAPVPANSVQQRDPVADAERALAFKARFASNLVAPAIASASRSDGKDDSPQALSASSPQATTGTTKTASKRPAEVSVNAAHGKPYVLFEGTTIDTVLLNRLDGEFSGPVKVMVTDPVYSQDRQHVLIPEGSFLLGEVQKVAGLGQTRVAVTFHRLLMPDGYSVDLDRFRGLDQAGATGLKDKVDHHYAAIFGASIALGVIAGATEATNQNQGYNQSGFEAYKSGIAASLSQSSAHVLDRFLNILPTLTTREGHRIKVYLTEDMLLPAYENHAVPGDI